MLNLLIRQLYEKNEFLERYNKSNDLDFSTNLTKKSFIVKYVFFDIERNIAKNDANKINKSFNDEISNEVDKNFENICDDILNTTRVDKINEVNKATLDFFA